MEGEKIIVGNWKMYKTIEETIAFIKGLAPLVARNSRRIYLAVPFTAIQPAAMAGKETKIGIGAQNMNDASEGAFTGEIAGRMLKEAGAQFVILGHSERRRFFHETDGLINKKIKRALSDEIEPLLCIGETEKEREEGRTEEVLKAQLKASLEGLSSEQMEKLLIAYEPVWAIGTGKTATPEIAQQSHHFVREVLAAQWSREIADKVALLYGGSVSPMTIKAILAESDIDGVLVGGASLSLESFSKIIDDVSDCK